MRSRYPGCHGVLVEPEELGLGLGWLDRPPPLRVEVEVVGEVERRPGAELVWWMEKTLLPGHPTVRAEMWREDEGRLWFGNRFLPDNGTDGTSGLNLALRIDQRRGIVSIAPPAGSTSALFEALGNVALPALAQAHGSLVLHASACSLGGRATLITAPGGSGKSSLLTGLVAAGWEAISEDQCVIDLGTGSPLVWPGTNWVRVRKGVNVPAPIRTVRFCALDKVAWDVDPWTRRTPTPVTRLVFLERPGEPLWEPVDPAIAIGLLARQSPWHHGYDAFGQSAFGALVDVALAVPAHRLRLPHSPRWLDRAVELLADDVRSPR